MFPAYRCGTGGQEECRLVGILLEVFEVDHPESPWMAEISDHRLQ